jgi:DNA-binding PadR family transcriptional regulator
MPMSIKYALLSLLDHQPHHGYQLKTAVEGWLGRSWPLNIGQVYTTLTRLERDGLVALGEVDAQGRQTYQITPAGRAALADWFATPVPRDGLVRDELLVKLVAAVAAGDGTAFEVIRGQRTATLQLLQQHTRHKAQAERQGDLPRLVVADLLIAQAEAEVAWLELCEARLRTAGRDRRGGGAAPLAQPSGPLSPPEEGVP